MIALATGLVVPFGASAQPSLDEAGVVRAARRSAPRLRIADASLRNAAAAIENAGIWPNPSISYQRQQTFDPQAESQDIVQLTVPFALGGARDARRGLANTVRARAEGVRDTARSDAVADALELFYRALAARRRVDIEQTMRRQLTEAQRVLASRQAAGEVSGYATARLAIESELARSRYEEALVQHRALRARLAGALGLEDPASLPPLSGSFDVGAPAPLQTLNARAFDQRVELSAAGRTEAAARDARGAASLAWIPNVTLRAGYQNLSETALGHGFNVQLSVQLPFFNHGQGLLALANAAITGAADRRRAMRSVVASEIAESHVHLSGMIAEQGRFRTVSAPHVELLLRSVGTGFQGGERTLLELIDAQRAGVDVARRQLTLDLSVRIADVRLRRASGAFR